MSWSAMTVSASNTDVPGATAPDLPAFRLQHRADGVVEGHSYLQGAPILRSDFIEFQYLIR